VADALVDEINVPTEIVLGIAGEPVEAGVTGAVTDGLGVGVMEIGTSIGWQAGSTTSKLNNHKLGLKADFLKRKFFVTGWIATPGTVRSDHE
jgi:hypothetical protein